ncbi:MAG: hypothetical protein IT436_13500 [Phycisphaerales bacterium]|nr:hypothetical protein [Phycisphaerales bacterium]
MASQWDKLRVFDGSIESAFEELCAQLARTDSLAFGCRFERNGRPDGGLECYAERPDGTQIGWQAKFFLRPPTSGQWQDLTESFKTALKTYPALIEFVVCLPQDRANSGGKRRMTRERWNAAVKSWQRYAGRQRRKVAITYWGTSELFDRLSKPEQVGRRRFWFDREFMEPAWFRQRFEEVWANNRRRYRPELHVDIPNATWFDPLLQTEAYIDTLRQRLGRVCDKIDDLRLQWPTGKAGDAKQSVQQSAERLRSIANKLPREAEGPIPPDIDEELRRVVVLLREQQDAIDQLNEKTADWSREMNEVIDALYEAGESVGNEVCRMNQARALLVLGDAGQGKSHLLFRIADHRTQRGQPVVLTCGIQYGDDHPWKRMTDELGLTCGRDEFLGALNAAGEASRCRALIAVDALNEAADPALWKRALSGMLKAVAPYPSVAIVLSTRGDFAEAVVPDNLPRNELPRVLHRGFAGSTAKATDRIFMHFGITAPDVPLLDPEFANPLFVVTLAESLQRAGLKTVPPGAKNIRWVFDLWLDGINARLSATDQLDYDVSERRVQRAASALSEAMSERNTRLLSVEEAKKIVDQVHPSGTWSKSLLRAMVSEDVVQKYQKHDRQSGTTTDCIRFTFDRFSDHHIARAILALVKGKAGLRSGLGPKGKLRRRVVLREGGREYTWPSLLLALAIELPEDPRFGCELSDVLKGAKLDTHVRSAVIGSVRWRSPETISPEVAALVRDDVRRTRTMDVDAQAWHLEALLQVAARRGHPLNADFLDAELRAETMPARDYWWSRPLTRLGDEDTVVMRLIDWMASPTGRKCDDETARLVCTCAAWLFSTPNRVIRDRATKAAVSVLLRRPALAADLLERFLDVDDPYVVERVLAVGYGVALRTNDFAGLGKLGRRTYQLCFEGDKLPVQLLARDYARGIVERAHARGVLADVDLARTQPPYRSDWPKAISRTTDWEKYFDEEPGANEHGLERVWWSISKDDFGRYVIGANSGQHDWLSYPLIAPLPEELVSEDPRGAHIGLLEDLAEGDAKRGLDGGEDPSAAPDDYAKPDISPSVASPTGRRLTRTERRHQAWFPIPQIQCMVMDDVAALGYESRLDVGVDVYSPDSSYIGRSGRKAERMGKKYQWMAYWRTQARIADRFWFSGHYKPSSSARYQGPWQINSARDIDPSCLLRRTAGGNAFSHQPCWWAPFKGTDFDRKCDDIEWLRDVSRVPAMQDLCEVASPSDGRRWVVGHRFVRLSADNIEGLMPEGWRRRDIWYRTVVVFVCSTDSGRLIDWLNNERRKPGENGHWLLPEAPDLSECFLGEFPDSAAFAAENSSYHGREAWGDVRRTGPPVACSLLVDGYFKDGELDCGRDEVLNFYLPSSELVAGLGLRHAEQDGHFENHQGRLIAWDPSVTESGPPALLVDRDALYAHAQKHGYHVVHFTYGEQRAMSESHAHDEYLGQLLFSGASRWDGERWVGRMDGRFDSPLTRKSSRTRR